jgi:hypothetical protein
MGSNTTFRMSGREFRLTKSRVEAAMDDVPPEPIVSHFVVVKGRRYPPRQVLSAATGVGSKSIRSVVAERRLRQLGFVTGKVSRWAAGSADHHARIQGFRKRSFGVPPAGKLRERRDGPGRADEVLDPMSRAQDAFDAQLRRHVGEWVATRGTDLLCAAPDAKSVITWLTEHDERAEAMYKVPENLSQISGTASA